MARAITYDNSEGPWSGQVFQADTHELGLGLVLIQNRDPDQLSPLIVNAYSIRDNDNSCKVDLEPNTQAYIRLQALGLFHDDSFT